MIMNIQNYQKRLWAKIDCDALTYNYHQMGSCVCSVVKANAYGHGAVQISRVLEKNGSAYFAVSNIEEAIQLRKAGIRVPILILGFTPIDCVALLHEYHIFQTIYNLDYAKQLSRECEKQNINVYAHLKIDTGMGRIGFRYHENEDEMDQALEACGLQGLIVVGIFTHFAIADEGINSFTQKQFEYFGKACDFLESNGVSFAVKHCSNSAAIIDYPSFNMDMVRAGLSLYGINPTLNSKVRLKPVLSLWSVVSNVKRIKKGDSISYGRTFVATNDMMVVTIPVGYADGFWRSNQGRCVYINGSYCKIIGRVCMDQIMVECENVKMGDLVEIYGEHISIEDVAKYNNTIPYEILCSIGERVPRVYFEKGRIIEIVDKLI